MSFLHYATNLEIKYHYRPVAYVRTCIHNVLYFILTVNVLLKLCPSSSVSYSKSNPKGEEIQI